MYEYKKILQLYKVLSIDMAQKKSQSMVFNKYSRHCYALPVVVVFFNIFKEWLSYSFALTLRR